MSGPRTTETQRVNVNRCPKTSPLEGRGGGKEVLNRARKTRFGYRVTCDPSTEDPASLPWELPITYPSFKDLPVTMIQKEDPTPPRKV